MIDVYPNRSTICTNHAKLPFSGFLISAWGHTERLFESPGEIRKVLKAGFKRHLGHRMMLV